MSHPPLISAAELAAALAGPTTSRPLVIDCSFDLADREAGNRAYASGHIPGAIHLDLENDLSAPKNGRNGRHPLPERAAFAQVLARVGANDDTLIVAYDTGNGSFAARLWWMVGWTGHAAVALLDGGVGAWRAAGQSLTAEPAAPRAPGHFSLREPLATLVRLEEVRANLDRPQRVVVDARAADRFRGENETLDPIAGHIPGARNRFFGNNLQSDGRFKPAAQLRAEFEAVIGQRPGTDVISQCGSGVTACHNLLAMEIAGLTGGALYAGSWSEWSAQPGAPVATGAD